MIFRWPQIVSPQMVSPLPEPDAPLLTQLLLSGNSWPCILVSSSIYHHCTVFVFITKRSLKVLAFMASMQYHTGYDCQGFKQKNPDLTPTLVGSLLQSSPLCIQLDTGLKNGLAAERSLVLISHDKLHEIGIEIE